MIIRKRQIEAFDEAVAESLECRVLAHLKRVLPRQCATLGEGEVRRRIRAGLAKAERHGFETDYDITRFVDLMFLLGPEFDTVGGVPWAGEVLSDPSLPDATARMDRLYAKLKQQALGPAQSPPDA